MDGAVLALYLFATFIGGLVSGLAGFALGLVVSGIWLHILTPLQAAMLMAGYGIFTQGYGIWKLRHALSWRKAAPYIVGSAARRAGRNDAAYPVWCQLQDWLKDMQCAVYQPALFAVLAMSAIALTVAGAATPETITLFALGLPVLLAGTWTFSLSPLRCFAGSRFDTIVIE
jgi:hypothetical protein